MNDNAKIFESANDFWKAKEIMNEFQKLHNLIRNDYEVLLSLTELKKENQVEFNTMYRSCLIRLFTMIESDLHALGKLDPYVKNKSKENFFEQFTNTFNQIAITFDKVEIKENYFTAHFDELSKIKGLRNSIVHPKKMIDWSDSSFKEFERVKDAFHNYNNFMKNLMNGFYIQIDYKKLWDM